MSLVGTRPPTVDEYEQYELGHRKRLAMKPGLTGMWQVSGRSDITDFDEVVALDAKYVIRSVVNSKYAIDVQWASVADGANIQLYEINGTNAQSYCIYYPKRY